MADWDLDIQRLAHWATKSTGSGEPTCCIVTAAPASGKTTRVPDLASEKIKKTCPDASLMLVTNAHDAGRVFELDVAPMVCTYRQAIDGAASTTLPDKTILFIDEDPRWGTEFAVSLTLLLGQLRLQLSRGLSMRVIILASNRDHRFVDIARHFGQGTMYMELSEPTTPLPANTYSVRDGNDVPTMIADRIMSAPDGTKHAIVCFFPPIATDTLRANLVGVDFTEAFLMDFDNTIQDCNYCLKVPDDLDHATKFCCIIFCPVSCTTGIFLQDYDTVHVVTGSIHRERVVDRVTGLVTRLDVANTAEEMREQESWARRTDAPEAFVYRRDHGIVPSPRRRDFIDNRQLGGFLCMLAQFRHFDLSPVHVSHLLTRDPTACIDMNRRLRLQGIFSADFELSEEIKTSAFLQVLPCLGYEHDLALLAGLQSSSPITAMVKVQWAALLYAGIDEIFRVGPADPAELHGLLCANKRGCMTHLARHGSLWLLLGIWKHAIMEELEQFFKDGDVTLCRGLVEVSFDSGRLAVRTMAFIAAVFEDLSWPLHGVEGARQVQREPEQLTEAEVEELQTQLLRVFPYQLILLDNEPRVTSIRTLAAQQCTSLSGAVTGGMVCEMVDYSYIRSNEQATDRMTLGICLSFSRSGGPTQPQVMFDFTWIPSSIVRRWLLQRAEPSNLIALTRNRLVEEPMRNPDEL